MNEGIKIGQKAKGFRFDNSSGVHYNEQMELMVGKTGTITAIYEDHFAITFGGSNSWTYPLGEYLAILREERLKELGILCEVGNMNEGIKMWQKAKGFRFDESSGVHYNEQMELMVGKTGTITGFYGDRFYITFDHTTSYAYPVNEYLAILREERLKELGL